MWLNPLLLAAPGLCAEIHFEFRIVGWTLVLALMIGGGVFLIVWARNWRRALNESCPDEPTLEDYRKLLDDGVLDPQEFERIRARLGSPGERPELRHGIQAPQLQTGIRLPPADPPPAAPPTSEPTS